jgi:hypothetical protein
MGKETFSIQSEVLCLHLSEGIKNQEILRTQYSLLSVRDLNPEYPQYESEIFSEV